jgi:hypothetical protein
MKKFLKEGMKVYYENGTEYIVTNVRINSVVLSQYDDNLRLINRACGNLDIYKIVWERPKTRQIYNPLTGKKIDISEESYQAMKKDWK